MFIRYLRTLAKPLLASRRKAVINTQLWRKDNTYILTAHTVHCNISCALSNRVSSVETRYRTTHCIGFKTHYTKLCMIFLWQINSLSFFHHDNIYTLKINIAHTSYPCYQQAIVRVCSRLNDTILRLLLMIIWYSVCLLWGVPLFEAQKKLNRLHVGCISGFQL